VARANSFRNLRILVALLGRTTIDQEEISMAAKKTAKKTARGRAQDRAKVGGGQNTK